MNIRKSQLLYQLSLEELKTLAADVLQVDKKTITIDAEIVALGFGLQSLASFTEGVNHTFGLSLHTGIVLEYTSLHHFCEYLLDVHQATIIEKFNLGSIPGDTSRLKASTLSQTVPSQTVSSQKQFVENQVKSEQSLPKQPSALSSEALAQKLIDDVANAAAALLEIEAKHLDTEAEINELGFDSISITKFARQTSEKFSVVIHPGVFFEYTTLAAFAAYLLRKHGDAVRSFYHAKPIVNTPKPVIIGAGITGMCISRALSKQGIEHIMLGDPSVNDTPKLGESMNEAASIDLIQEYAEFSQYFFLKKEISFYSRDTVALLNLRGKEGHSFYDAYNRLGFSPQTEYANMIHIDRLGFDRALFNQVSASSYCTIIPNLKVTELAYDDNADTINKITLENGQILNSSYVFDASNHVRLLGKLLNIKAKVIDAPRYVTFTHYVDPNNSIDPNANPRDPDSCANIDDEPWLHATSIVRLHKELDGINGVAWCIPAGSYVSVGLSVDADEAQQYSKEQTIELLNKAYRRRGIDYLSKFTQRREIVLVPGTRHFTHEKIIGKNWLMAGGAGSQYWFPSSSNISVSLMAATLAPKVVQGEDASALLDVYQQINNNLGDIHWIYDRWINGDHAELPDLGEFAKAIYSIGNQRMALYAMIRNDAAYAEVAKEMSTAVIPQYAMMNQEVRVFKEGELDQQTTRLNQARTALLVHLDKSSNTGSSETFASEESVVEVV